MILSGFRQHGRSRGVFCESSDASKFLPPICLAPTGQIDRRWRMPSELTPNVIAQTPDETEASVTDEESLLAELASLSPLDYDKRRKSAAELLSVRMSALDAEITARRSKIEEQNATEQLAAAMP